MSFEWEDSILKFYVDQSNVFNSKHTHSINDLTNLTPGNIGAMEKQPAFIEISNSIPYIDFHYDRSTKDYTTRIIESSEGHLDVYTPGNFNVESGYIMSSNRPVAIKSNSMSTNLFQSFAYPGPVFIPYGSSASNTPDDSTAGMLLYVPISDDWTFRVAFTSNGGTYIAANYLNQSPSWKKI